MVKIVERPVLIVALSLALIVPIWSTLPALAQPTPDMVIQRMDQDGDGKVSQKEFIGRRKPFSFFDRNGDGYATREEIAASMQEARGLQSPQSSGASGDSGFLQSTQVQNLLAGSHVSHISPKNQKANITFNRDGSLSTMSESRQSGTGKWWIKGPGILCIDTSNIQYSKNFCALLRRNGNQIDHYHPKTRERMPANPWFIESPGPQAHLVPDTVTPN